MKYRYDIPRFKRSIEIFSTANNIVVDEKMNMPPQRSRLITNALMYRRVIPFQLFKHCANGGTIQSELNPAIAVLLQDSGNLENGIHGTELMEVDRSKMNGNLKPKS